MTKLIVGVDISKVSFSAAGLGAEGKESFAGTYTMDREGFIKFLESITSHCPNLPEVLVGMESTVCYQINLFSFLSSQGIRTLVINPLLIANYAKPSLGDDLPGVGIFGRGDHQGHTPVAPGLSLSPAGPGRQTESSGRKRFSLRHLEQVSLSTSF